MKTGRRNIALSILTLLLAIGLVGCGGGSGENWFSEEMEGATAQDPGGDDDDVDDGLTTHERAFTVTLPGGYVDATSCLGCHDDVGDHLVATGHWKWEGTSSNIEGFETETHGKTDLINNFCIAIPSNEGRCTQCHIGYGWANDSFDFANQAAIDCLVCHDTTGTYQKAKTTAGNPEPTVDPQTVAINVGRPTRSNCGSCHFFAGGGDNVKHPDLPSTMASPTRAQDVHMGLDGADFSCQVCHEEDHHGIAGMSLHSTDEGAAACTDCHSATSVHDDANLNNHLDRVACQTCHIPAFARSLPTKMEWYWEDAGQDVDPIPTDSFGKPLYDKKKGTFVWDMNVRPTVRWHDGKWNRMVIGQNDRYTSLPAVLAEPVGSKDDPGSKLYPFKRMIGTQPADAGNQTVLVPHLFGMGAGPNPYWVSYDWNLALAEGAAYAGQTYTGAFEFVDTVMYLSVNHEVAPKEQALGCGDCHFGGIDWIALGYSDDPMSGGK